MVDHHRDLGECFQQTDQAVDHVHMPSYVNIGDRIMEWYLILSTLYPFFCSLSEQPLINPCHSVDIQLYGSDGSRHVPCYQTCIMSSDWPYEALVVVYDGWDWIIE